MKNFAGIFCAVLMVFSFVMPVQTASALSKIDPLIIQQGINSEAKVEVFVELNGNTVVDNMVFGNPDAIFSSKEIMRPNNIATKFAEKKIISKQMQHIHSAKTFAPDMQVGARYQYVFNGYFATLLANQVEKIAAMPDVKYIYFNRQNYPTRTRARVFLGNEKVWNTVKDPKGRAVDGTGVLVGVTDSGLDYTQSDFGSQKSPVGPKVKISRDLAYNDNDCQEEENLNTVGHGTACAGIIAADGPLNPKTKVWEKGLAPKVSLAGFKIGMRDQRGLSGQGIMLSLEWNVKDKVEISNNSYGGSGGVPYYEGAHAKCAQAGCLMLVAMGNEGSPGPNLPIPASSTAAARSCIGVAALDDTDAAKIEVLEPGNKASIKGKVYVTPVGATGQIFSSMGTPFEVVDCGWGRKEDFAGLDLKGKIALIERGPSKDLQDKFGAALMYKDKNLNAASAGAKAILLYNYDIDVVRAQYYDPSKEDPKKLGLVPSFELSSVLEGIEFQEALHGGHEAQLGTPDLNQNKVTIQIKDIGRKGTMADYSSNGPNALGYLKPDIAAPADGTHTTAAEFMKKYFPSGYWEVFNGTSAACPMVAGCAALVRQGRPELSPMEIKRVLMNTADPLKRFSGDYYIPMIQQGMGRVNTMNAVTSNLLFQPASTCIVVASGKTNMTDPAAELFTEEGRANIPEDVLNSKIPIKICNYSAKQSKIDLSFEINSAHAEAISVDLTTTELVIPPADKKGNPGVAWFGANVTYAEVKGKLNDVYIWASDRAQNKKWHVGVCVYNQDPSMQGAVTKQVDDIEMSSKYITPNGDGEDEQIEIKYEITRGQNQYFQYGNFAYFVQFYVVDQNSEEWALIHYEPMLELGPHSFVWNGKDIDGNYVLPDGDWSLMSGSLGYIPYQDGPKYVIYGDDIPNSEFTVDKSTIPSLATLSAHVLPLEPGVGQEFEVGLYLHNAKDVKSLQFKINMPGASSIVQYMGCEKGDFFVKDEPLSLVEVEYDKDKELFDISLQRPLDGVSGDGWILKLKFMAKNSNYFDIRFSDLLMSAIDDKGKEVKTKAFYKNGEISILNQAYDVADFNRDSKVDDADLKIIMTAMNSVDGDGRYNWRCDLNYDLKVTTDDIAIFSKSYRKR